MNIQIKILYTKLFNEQKVKTYISLDIYQNYIHYHIYHLRSLLYPLNLDFTFTILPLPP